MKIPILFLDRENLTDRETVDGPVAVRLAGRNEKHLFARSHRLRLVCSRCNGKDIEMRPVYTEGELRAYAQAHGYKAGWVWHRLYEQEASLGSMQQAPKWNNPTRSR